MAGVFGVEEAVNRILYEENGDNQITNDEIVEEIEDGVQERPVEKIERCLSGFEGCSGFDKDKFMSIGKNVLLPVVEMCESQKNQVKTVLESTSVNTAYLLRHEAELWLDSIYRRLAARRSIKHPYYAEIHRDIPAEIFNALYHAIKSAKDSHLQEPLCYLNGNKKGKVISLTTISSVINLFTVLSGKQQDEVALCMKRTLGGYA